MENIENIKRGIIAIVSSTNTIENKLEQLNQMIGTLNPLENPKELFLVCDTAILCANRIGKTEMVAQLYLIKAKAEIAKETFLIHELKNLTLALGWFGFALKSERDRYEKIDKRIKEIWSNTEKYIADGFTYLKKKPFVGPAAYCYTLAGEIYASFYLQQKLYYFTSGRPWRARIAGYRFIRFLGIDDLFLLNKKSRKQIQLIKHQCLKCFKLAIKYYKKEKSWTFLVQCYISLTLEHHSFNSPIRSKIALYKAKRLIKKYKISGQDDRLESVKNLPFIANDKTDHFKSESDLSL